MRGTHEAVARCSDTGLGGTGRDPIQNMTAMKCTAGLLSETGCPNKKYAHLTKIETWLCVHVFVGLPAGMVGAKRTVCWRRTQKGEYVRRLVDHPEPPSRPSTVPLFKGQGLPMAPLD